MNRRISIREVADDVGISFGSCQAIFQDVLGMKREAAKVVPKLLYFEQKQRRMDIAQEMLTMFIKAITADESWVYGYDIETKAQLASKRAKTEKSTSSSVKCDGFANYFLRLQWRDAS